MPTTAISLFSGETRQGEGRNQELKRFNVNLQARVSFFLFFRIVEIDLKWTL